MNNKLSFTHFIPVAASLFFGCSEPVKQESKYTPGGPITWHAGDERYVAIDTAESVVSWKGSNSFGSHSGFVYISKGELMMEEGQLKGGAVEVDMKTIEDDNHDSENGVIKHLTDPDFFDVTKFPIAAIAITRVQSMNTGENEITGDLTIKNITHPVSFPSKLEVRDRMVKVTARLVIDRTKWGVRYGSGKFFDNLKDQTISDSIEFNIKIVAKK